MRGRPSRGARASRARAALWIAAALLALGAAERGVRLLVSRHLPTAGAEWIWAPEGLEHAAGFAFYAVRDFELDWPPESARVLLLADEAYILHLNGRRVGSGAYYAHAPLDSYRLDGALRPGWNRLAVELRSGRGAGGLLLALFADGERAPMLKSDAAWRIFADAAGVVAGTRRFADGAPALVWQSPPHGGWGLPRLGSERPTFDHAVAMREGRLDPPVLEPHAPPPPSAAGGMPRPIDFGDAVTGYLVLRGLDAAPRRMQVGIGLESAGEGTVDVVLADGQTEWSAAESLTLRFVTAGLPAGSPAVIPVLPAIAAADAERAVERRRGVFGVEPPSQRH